MSRLNAHKLHVAYNNVFSLLFKMPRWCCASEMFAVNTISTSNGIPSYRTLQVKAECLI